MIYPTVKVPTPNQQLAKITSWIQYMNIRSIKEHLKKLQYGPFRLLVAIVATIQQTIKHRSPVLIFVDKDGDWHNRRRGVTFVAPELHVSSYGEVLEAVKDLWCYDYALRNGDTVIDVGAGIGDDTVVFSRLVGVNGRVVAIEAHPHTFRCLVKTIEANRLENVIALNVAVSEQNGEITISDGKSYLSNSIVAGVGTIRIRACTIDNVLSEIDGTHTDLIKMNIEGAETCALHGMEETFLANPHIVVSCHDFKADRGEDPSLRTYDDVSRLLTDAGYILRGRREDARKEVGYYLYGRKIDRR